MIADIPEWMNQSIPYITCPSSGGITQPLWKFVEVGSKSALRLPEEQKLHAFGTLKKNWDRRGSLPPTATSIAIARGWLPPLRDIAQSTGFAWRTPHMSVSESGEITFEWWRGERKITLYFGDHAPEYVKVWGPHIFDQMEAGNMMSSDSFQPLWLWLNAA